MQEDICLGTHKTLETVDACPENRIDLQRRQQKKNCDTFPPCRREPLVYHCVRFNDYIVEICVPVVVIRGMLIKYVDHIVEAI